MREEFHRLKAVDLVTYATACMRMLQGREKALCLFFTVHLTSFLFTDAPCSASNPKAPQDSDCSKQSGKKSHLSFQKHNVR